MRVADILGAAVSRGQTGALLPPRFRRRLRLHLAGIVLLAGIGVAQLSLAQAALAAETPVADPSASPDPLALDPALRPANLARLIWSQNPELQQARAELIQDRAELLKSTQWQNPTLQAGVGTIPLSRMVLTSPNYQNAPLDPLTGPSLNVSFSQPVEFGKRDLRVQRYRQALQASLQNLRLLYQQRLADAEENLIRAAISRLRRQLLLEQLKALEALSANVKLSVSKGFAPPLDAERLELEQGHLQVDIDAEEITQSSLRAQWAKLTLSPAPVLSLNQSEAIVHAWCQAPARWPDKIPLPQQAALSARQDEAQSDLELAHRMAWPDPNFQIGYTYDSSTQGSVVHSLGTSVSINLPIWQSGQSEALAAQGQLQEIELQRRSLQASLSYQEPALRQQIETLARNLAELQNHRLVLARATLARYTQALDAHGLTLTELIQTRRTVLDLEGQRLDLLQQLGLALVDYRRLTAWNLPEPQLEAPSAAPGEEKPESASQPTSPPDTPSATTDTTKAAPEPSSTKGARP